MYVYNSPECCLLLLLLALGIELATLSWRVVLFCLECKSCKSGVKWLSVRRLELEIVFILLADSGVDLRNGFFSGWVMNLESR
jgi:hypothetical protein